MALSELDAWLQAKPTGGPYCIEVTELTADDLKGSYNPSAASPLGKILKKYPDKLVALKLPANVEGLNYMYNCFRECTSLVSVQTIPAGVTSIYCCFYGCSSLKQAPVIPSGVTNMGSCFINCSSLEQAPAIPSGVNSMGSCFMGCSSLTQAPAIPSNVTNISYCFRNCSGLKQGPEIPASVTKMNYCFDGCTALAGVTLRCNYASAPDGNFTDAFDDCTALEDGGIKVPSGQLATYQANAASMRSPKQPGPTTKLVLFAAI